MIEKEKKKKKDNNLKTQNQIAIQSQILKNT